MQTWDAERVRNELPNIPVYFKKSAEVKYCRVIGKRMPYARVLTDPGGVDVSWEALADILNNMERKSGVSHLIIET